MEKLKSRKMWFSVLASVVVIVGHQYGIPAKVLLYAAGALMSYVGVEGSIDLVSLLAKSHETGKEEVKP